MFGLLCSLLISFPALGEDRHRSIADVNPDYGKHFEDSKYNYDGTTDAAWFVNWFVGQRVVCHDGEWENFYLCSDIYWLDWDNIMHCMDAELLMETKHLFPNNLCRVKWLHFNNHLTREYNNKTTEFWNDFNSFQDSKQKEE